MTVILSVIAHKYKWKYKISEDQKLSETLPDF